MNKSNEILESALLSSCNIMSDDFIKESGFPALPEICNQDYKGGIHIDTFLKIHYLNDTGFYQRNELLGELENIDSIRKLVNDGIIEENWIQHYGDIRKTIDLNTISITQEWFIEFFCKVSNISGRKFLFEHYADESFSLFEGFDTIGYEDNYLDRFLRSLSKHGVQNMQEAFRLINTNTSNLEEKKFILFTIYTLSSQDDGFNVFDNLHHTLNIIEAIKDSKNINYLSTGEINKLREGFTLMQINGTELSIPNILKYQNIYKFVPDVISGKYGQTNFLTDFINGVTQRGGPEVAIEATRFKRKLDRGKKNLSEFTKKYSDYFPEITVPKIISDFSKDIHGNIVQPVKEKMGPVIDGNKEKIEIGVTLLTNDFREKKDKFAEERMKSTLIKHKLKDEGLDDISEEEYIELYKKYYFFKKLVESIDTSFNSGKQGIQKKSSGGLWKRLLHYSRRIARKGAFNLTLRYKFVKTIAFVLGKSSKGIYAVLAYAAFESLTNHLSQIDIVKKYNSTNSSNQIKIGPKTRKFLLDNIDELKDFSFGLEELERVKEITKKIDDLDTRSEILEKYSSSTSDYTEIELEKNEKEKIKLEKEYKFIQEELSMLDFGKERCRIINEFYMMLERENERLNSNYMERSKD